SSNGSIIGSTLRGVVHHNDHNPQQAVEAFEPVLELDPELREIPLERTLFWRHLADDLVSSGRINDARRHLSEAPATTSDPQLLNRLGHAYFLQGGLDDAERCFRRAVDLDPGGWAAHANLAKLAIQRHNHEEALRQLNEARALAPDEHGILYSLAAVFQQL